VRQAVWGLRHKAAFTLELAIAAIDLTPFVNRATIPRESNSQKHPSGILAI